MFYQDARVLYCLVYNYSMDNIKRIDHMKKLIVILTTLLLTLNMAWAGPGEHVNVAVLSAAPAKLPLGYITSGKLTWAPISATAVTLAEAKNICASSTALGYKWRQPTKDELVALYAAYRNKSAALRAQGWTLYDVWSSTPGTVIGLQFIVNLDGGIVNYGDDNGVSHVSCVS